MGQSEWILAIEMPIQGNLEPISSESEWIRVNPRGLKLNPNQFQVDFYESCL